MDQYQEGKRKEDDASPIVARTKCFALPPFTTTTTTTTTGTTTTKSSSSREKEESLLCESLYIETLEVTLEEYDKVCQPLFDRSVVPATRLIDELTLQREEIDEIVMVGGTTRMPQVRELVRQAFPNAQLNTHIDPDITVVRIYNAILCNAMQCNISGMQYNSTIVEGIVLA